MLAALALVVAACAETDAAADPVPSTPPSAAVAPTTASPATVPAPTSPTTAPSEPTTTTPTTTSTTTTSTTITGTTEAVTDTSTVTTTPPSPSDEAARPNLEQALFFLALDNRAVSITVHRDGETLWRRAVGRRVDGESVTSDSPFVVASVSKLVTALSIARLVESGVLTVDTPIPWGELGLAHDPLWDTVTVRELLDHTSGMPVNRKSWLDDPGPCSVPLAEVLAEPPTIARTTWRYSNGNYCALGLLVEHLTDLPLDEAAYELVLEPAGITGPYLSIDGLRGDSAPSPRGVARLSRLGGAGTWLASTDDVATMLDSVTPEDLEVLRWPGILVDQYGWGHTGTVDGAKACAWVMEDGRTTVAAAVSGPEPATGGDVCDRVVQAVALDLGIWAGEPVRSPV